MWIYKFIGQHFRNTDQVLEKVNNGSDSSQNRNSCDILTAVTEADCESLLVNTDDVEIEDCFVVSSEENQIETSEIFNIAYDSQITGNINFY